MNLPTIIADAVAKDLNAHAFSQTFTAERRFRPRRDLKELETLRVSAVPKTKKGERLTRAQWAHDVQVDIGVQQHMGKDADEEQFLEAMLDFVEEISDYFEGVGRLASYPKARVMAVAQDPIYAPEHIDQKRLFTSIVTLTLKVA